MRLDSVTVKNFRSIKDLTLPICGYGNGNGQSNTMFLLGLNETGKSAIIEAIRRINDHFNENEYPEVCHRNSLETDETIIIKAVFKSGENELTSEVSEVLKALPSELANQVKITTVSKYVFLKPGAAGHYWRVEIEPIELKEYIVSPHKKQGKIIPYEQMNIYAIHEYIGKRLGLPPISALKDFDISAHLSEDDAILDSTILTRFIAAQLNSYLDDYLPKFIVWKPEPEYLMSNAIDLEKFKDNPTISQTLRSLFHIYGKKTDDEIKKTVERALSNQENIDELKDGMSAATTKHLNSIWKEHPVKINVSINGTICSVSVEDKDKQYKYFRLNQRSDGFKQFVSLILSISAYNKREDWSNNIILIDEPEVHLHPSGIQFMRDEILKIGKKNDVVVATHSQQMVDTTCPERHWIVSKVKSETSITQVDKDSSFFDDEVMAAAFGLHLLKELLPSTIILVEGIEDKLILGHVLMLFSNRPSFSIKSANGASKVYGIAALSAEEKLKSYIVLDDDKDGKDAKKSILENLSACYSADSVLTIKDIDASLPSKSMIEDLLPIQFVKSFFSDALKSEIVLDDLSPVIYQLKQQNETMQNDKQKLNSLKKKLAEKFITEYDTFVKIESEAPRLFALVSKLLSKFETN